MATTISTQDLIDVKRDIDDIGKAVNEKVIVSPRYGEDFKSLPMIAAEAQSTINEWQDAINTITVNDGVPALAVVDGDKNQHQINNYFRSVIVTPELFGAVAGGPDASAAMQAAVSFCIANKCELNGNFKTYHCADVKFDSSFKMRNIFLICNKFDQDMISVLDAVDSNEILSGVEFTNVHIDGQRDKHTNIRGNATQEDGGRHGFRFYRHIDGVTMINCSGNYCATDGIELFCRSTKIKNFKAFNCKFNWNRRHGGSGDTLRGVEFISCEFNDNGRDLPSATGTRDNTKGIWGDRPDSKIYSVGFDIEEYAGFAFSQDVYFINCIMLRNTYAAVTVYRTGDYTDNVESKNINFIGGTYDKGSLNASNMSFEFSPFSPWTDYRKAFYDINVSNVDCLGGTIYLRYGTINIANIKNVTKIAIQGRSVCYADRNYVALENSESTIYVGGELYTTDRQHSLSPIMRLDGKSNTGAQVELNNNEGSAASQTSYIDHIIGGNYRGRIKMSMDGFWGTTIFRFIASNDETKGLELHPYQNYLAPLTHNVFDIGTPTNYYKNTFTKRVTYSDGVFDAAGTGSPEGVVTANVGSTYRRLDGGASTTFYVKQSGAGNTGWIAK